MPIVLNIPGVTFTNPNLPVLARDPLIVAGTQFLFDFKNTYCWPTQAAPTIAASMNNLVEGAAVGTWSTANANGFSGGGIILSASGGFLNLGTGYTALYAGLNKFVTGCTFGMPASFGSSFYPGFFGRGVNTSNFIARADLGTDGKFLRVNRFAIGDYNQTLVASTVYDMVMSWEPSGTNAGVAKVFMNGALVNTATITNTALPTSAVAATPWIFGNGGMGGNPDFKGKLFRCFAEDITASGRTPEAVAAANWAFANGRFTA